MSELRNAYLFIPIIAVYLSGMYYPIDDTSGKKVWPMGILFLLLPSLLSYVYGYNTFDISKSQIRDGEWGAMWCFV